eukprot:c26590_g1_i1 orf=421-2790(+)
MIPGGASTSDSAGFSGFGAVSHVYIQYPPFRCNIPGAIGMMYDDGNKLLLVPSPNKVFSWTVNRHPHSDNPSITSIREGPVLALRFSLDRKFLAVQRSNSELELICRETGATCLQQCKYRAERILGFFWTDCPTCNLVFVTTGGLELYALQLEMTSLKLVDARRLNVSWYIYTHESRLVLLASGMQCKTLSGYQFSSGGIINLPKFDVNMAKPESNRKPVLAPEDIQIAIMYGRIYCLQVDRVAMHINLYRFYRDAVVPQGALPIYSINVAISVVDNVLLFHQIDSKVVLLYDISSDPNTPISSPLPLLLRGFSIPSGPSSAEQWEVLAPSEAEVYGAGWVFVNPDIILDHAHGLLWRIHLDLEAIMVSSSDIPFLLAFLQRRRQEASKAKQLSLTVLRLAIQERRPLSLIADAMDVITFAYAHATRSSSALTYTQFAIHSLQSTYGDTHHGGKLACRHVSSSMTGEENHVLPEILEANSDSEQKQNRRENGIGRVVERSGSNEINSSTGNTDQDSQENTSMSDMNAIVKDTTVSLISDSHLQVFPIEKEDLRNGTMLLQERPPMSENGSGKSHSFETHNVRSHDSQFLELHSSQGVSAAISPNEMLSHVFANVKEEMGMESAFLVASMIEYMRSAAAEKLKVGSALPGLIVQLLARDKRYAELRHFVSSKVLEPSREVALQLVQVGNQNTEMYRLGMDMLKQVLAHTEYVSLLLQSGRLLEALRYVRKNKVGTIPPSTFLDYAAAIPDTHKMACVLRFCLDFVPNFEQTSDYKSYFEILKQQRMKGTG